MDERYRDSLQRHYNFLMTHILLTDDVIQLLANEKILPETMIKDIQDGDTKEERNKRLLNALRLRGNKSYKRFRELMYRTGNFFVADLLWEEEDGQGPMIDEEELAAKFSNVTRCLQETQRKKLVSYLDAKIREKALVLSWRQRPGDRMESLSARVVDFNQEKGFRDTIAAQERKIKDLECELKKEDDKRRTLRLELSSQQQRMKALQREHVSQLATQSRFHDANMATITRLKNKLTSCKSKVTELIGVITTILGDGGGEKRKPAATKEDDDDDEEEEEVKVSELEKNVQHLVQQFHHEKDQARNGRIQREDVLKLLNRGYTKEPLASVVKEVLKHEQKHRAMVMRDIQRLSDTLRQVVPSSTLAPPGPIAVNPSGLSVTPPVDPATLDTKHFKNKLSMLRAEAEHIQKRFQWKDSETANLRQELFALNQRFQDYKIISSVTRQPAPQPTTHTTADAVSSAPNTHLLCASCAKAIASQTSNQTTTLPNNQIISGENLGSRIALRGSATSRDACEEKKNFPAGGDFDNHISEGSASRRGSMGKSDLDKTVVNVDEYLQDEEDEGFQNDMASLKKPSLKGAGEVKGGNARSRRDSKNTSALNKSQAKRKTNQR